MVLLKNNDNDNSQFLIIIIIRNCELKHVIKTLFVCKSTLLN